MPSAVQNWLEEQLEARGIDAAIYSRYILSLLRPDTLDHPDSFDLSTNNKNCGIESLVDELCAKLKEIQGEAEGQKDVNSSIKTVSTDLPAPSSNKDLALKYYAAFPALTAKSGGYDTEISSFNLPRTSVWCGKRILGSSFGKNRTYSEGHNREKPNGNFSWLEENKENQARKKDVFIKEKMRSRSSVKQQICEKGRRNMAKSLDRKDDDSFRVVKIKPDSGNKSRRLYQRPGDTSNEPNYCKLVTCSTIKALWTPEKFSEDLSGCDQDLPMDFQQLLESPEATKIRFDFSKSIRTKQPSFIQCGTNITSSIWSEKIEDNSMDCSGCEGIADLNTGMSLSVGESVWKNSVFDEQGKAVDNKNFLNSRADDCFKPLHQPWSDGENKFSDSPWKMMHNFHNFENIMQQFCNDSSSSSSKWSDVEGTSLILNSNGKFYSSFYNAYGSSLSTLNHNREDSSFTEVIPKNTGAGLNKKLTLERVETPSTSDVKKEEEDLLTSMRTHFRPIRQDAAEVSATAATLSFPDGTTFPISNSLDKPSFQRSASGALYLDADYQQKYMEYHDPLTRSFGNKFVPKFRVEQNEKFCQTEDVSRIEEEEENDVPSDQNGDEFEEFYFPEDESLVKGVVDDDEEVDCSETEGNLEQSEWSASCIKVNGWVAAWPATGIWSVSAANKPEQSWCNVWSGSVADIKCNTDDGDQYMKLRDEWTEEAEELLSDLSSIQNLYLASADYMDSNDSPKVHTAKAPLVEPAYVQWGGKLAAATFTRTLPFPTPYSVMQT